MRTDNPIVMQLFRGGRLESLHRGAWVLVEPSGAVVDCAGDADQPIFPRSATKSLQALPLLETGAADRFGFDDRHLALALASHSGETEHLEVASSGLELLGIDADALQCGPQRPMFSPADTIPERIANNCSGKHVGFLAVAKHLNARLNDYLHPDSQVQQLVRHAVETITGASTLTTGTDGCSAPTFEMPLAALATGLARLTNPEHLAPDRAAACRRLTTAAAQHPSLVAGSHERFCTDLIRATAGRVFGKIGAEGVYVFGVVGEGLGFAGKVDDGNARALYPLILSLLEQRDLLTTDEHRALDHWSGGTLRNWDGLEVGHRTFGPEAANDAAAEITD